MRVKGELNSLLIFFLEYMPGDSGCFLRYKYYKKRFFKCGNPIRIGCSVAIDCPRRIALGNYVELGPYNHLCVDHEGLIEIGNRVATNRNVTINAAGGGRIFIGDNTMIGPNVVMRSNNHSFADSSMPMRDQKDSVGEIIIEDDVWIGSNAVILSNVRIGRGSVIGAGSVVTKDIPPYYVAFGVPARPVKSRLSNHKERN